MRFFSSSAAELFIVQAFRISISLRDTSLVEAVHGISGSRWKRRLLCRGFLYGCTMQHSFDILDSATEQVSRA